MNIGVYGHTDKRPVIYSLLKILQANGDVALISDNRHYKRLLEGRESLGHMANILISVSDATPDEVFDEIQQAPTDFDHIIYDIIDTVPDDLDLIIYVRTYPLEEDDEAFLELLGEHVVFHIDSYVKTSDKGVYSITLPTNVWAAIEKLEALRILEPIPSASLQKAIASVLSTKIFMSPQAIVKVLNRRWDVQ